MAVVSTKGFGLILSGDLSENLTDLGVSERVLPGVSPSWIRADLMDLGVAENTLTGVSTSARGVTLL